MKKRITLVVAMLILLAMALSSCGGSVGKLGKISNVDKFLNTDYALESDVYKTDAIIAELTDYVIDNSNNEFVVLASGALENLTYKVLSLRTGKVVGTYSDAAFTFDILLSGYGIPVYCVAKTDVANPENPDAVIETTYYVYDGTGKELSATKYQPDEAYRFNDEIVIFDYATYTEAEDGALTKDADLPEYLVDAELVDYGNDDYYYMIDDEEVIVYDHSFGYVSSWTAPSYVADDGAEINVLNNGDLFVQYMYALDDDDKDFDFYYADGDINIKMDIVTLVVSAKNGKAKEIDCDYLVDRLYPNSMLYNEKDGDENFYNDKFENLAWVYPIIDRQIDSSDTAADVVLMNNKGKIEKSVKLVDGQVVDTLYYKIADDKYLVDTVYGCAIVDGKGKVIKTMNNYLDQCGTYFVGDVAIYDLELNKVYDLREKKATVETVSGETIFVREDTDNGYNIVSFNNGNQNTVYTYDETATSNTVFTPLDGIGYEIYDPASGDYKFYNVNGDLITTTTYALEVVTSSYKNGTVVLVSTGAASVTYHVFKIG